VKSTEAKFKKVLSIVGANLKRIRKSRTLSQSDMQDYGFELRNYQRLESGKHSPSLYTLHRLAIVFRCNIKEFFEN